MSAEFAMARPRVSCRTRVLEAKDRTLEHGHPLFKRLRALQDVVLEVAPVDIVVTLHLRRGIGVMECVLIAEFRFLEVLAPARVETPNKVPAAERFFPWPRLFRKNCPQVDTF